MRKRLIEKLTKQKKGSLGYTLMEMLVVIGIVVIACAIAIPSILSISRALRFKQRNEYAKSIFLAAQQNLTEMRADGDLPLLEKKTGGAVNCGFPAEFEAEYLCTTTGTDAFNLILPAGIIDAELRDDQIVIEYNPLTGNVYAVFYCDEDDVDIAGLYNEGTLPREDEKVRKELMVGYYEGSGLNSSQIEPEKTDVTVEFINGQEGVVRVLVPMPESFFGEYNNFAEAMQITLTIFGEQTMEEAMKTNAKVENINIQMKSAGDKSNCYLASDGRTVVVEYPIDSLRNYYSFVNYASNTAGVSSLTNIENEDAVYPDTAVTYSDGTATSANTGKVLKIKPGENVTIQADVAFVKENVLVESSTGMISGVNPMFEYLQPSANGGYVLAVSNGRNMQNLNAIAPSIGVKVDSVVFTSDIYWNETVAYYNKTYAGGSEYTNSADEAPARQLPYFVPIHSESLFGTAKFIYPTTANEGGTLAGIISNIFKEAFSVNDKVPTMTDELDEQTGSTGKKIVQEHAAIVGDDQAHGDGANIYYLRIDTTKYCVDKAGYYAGTTTVLKDEDGTETIARIGAADNDRFTGLFSYVNTSIDNIHIVNPIIKGFYFRGSGSEHKNNPATGALVGATGYNAYISNSSVYLDMADKNFVYANYVNHGDYNPNGNQTWYGVSGEGAVGGLVGYAKSHRTTKGYLSDNKKILAFNGCFAAVNVSGNLRPGSAFENNGNNPNGKNYGYSSGIGGLVGNSQLTNFYNCYASGNVKAKNAHAVRSAADNLAETVLGPIMKFFSRPFEAPYSGRDSAGAGGFVGTSHGTRYTNCFATGDVAGTNSTNANLAVGGFVGVMCMDETFAYGNNSNVTKTTIKQHSVFTNCYSVGTPLNTTGNAVDEGNDEHIAEGFSGATARLMNDSNFLSFLQSFVEGTSTSAHPDYYQLLAPHYIYNQKTLPDYDDFYIFKDSYYLTGDSREGGSSLDVAVPELYGSLIDLPAMHKDENWIDYKINKIRNYELLGIDLGFFEIGVDYQDMYFNQDNAGLTAAYQKAYKQGFDDDEKAGNLNYFWTSATSRSTFGYDKNGTYPFSMLQDMPYYGDWPAEPLGLGLAYYESYAQATKQSAQTYGYYYDRDSTSTLQNTGTAIVSKDGYAIFSKNHAAMTIVVEGIEQKHSRASDQPVLKDGTPFYAYWLTDDQMEAAAVFTKKTGQFYVPVTVTQQGKTFTMYFNPNVAKSHVSDTVYAHPYTDADVNERCDSCNGKYTEPGHQLNNHTYTGNGQTCTVQGCGKEKDHAIHQPAKAEMSIRSARQFAAMKNMVKFLTDEYTYVQELHIDAALNEWTIANSAVVNPIGYIPPEDLKKASMQEFNAQYRADLLVDEEWVQTRISGFTPAISGLFGKIGTNGGIENILVECNDGTTVTSTEENVGILAGENHGTLTNVDIKAVGTIQLTAKTNAGLLAGLSSGTVTECDVEADAVVLEAENAGVLIGSASGAVTGEGDEMVTAKAVINNATLKMNGLLTINGAVNAGAVVGYANNLNSDTLTAQLSGMTIAADYAGGLAGCAESSELVAANVSLAGNYENTKAGTEEAPTYMAGAIGSGKDVKVTNGKFTLAKAGELIDAKLNGYIVSGFLGTGVNVDATDCEIKLQGDPQNGIYGIAGAAGVAGSIGPQSVFNRVNVSMISNHVQATGGNAAGYALNVQPEAYVTNSKARIYNVIMDASGDAAGFACYIAGDVDSSSIAVDILKVANEDGTYSISGKSDIGGANAAGFAITIDGHVAKSYVSPAATNEQYANNANENLNILATGDSTTGKAAGFVLNVGKSGVVSECYTLCNVLGVKNESGSTNSYGFAAVNAGDINGCMANIDISSGYAFVGENSNIISRSYGWYADREKYDGHDVIVTINNAGTVRSCYFANLLPMPDELATAFTMYAGATNEPTASNATDFMEDVLNTLTGKTEENPGTGDTWYSAGSYYPYNADLEKESGGYPYPTLGNHYGDWVDVPLFTYGVAYYEKYSGEDSLIKIRLVELSNPKAIVEGDHVMPTEVCYLNAEDGSLTLPGENETIAFDNSGEIVEARHVIFAYQDNHKLETGAAISDLFIQQGEITYSFYNFNEAGEINIPATYNGGFDVALNTWYADTINDSVYKVRTPGQLSKVGELVPRKEFVQTHDIAIDSGFTTVPEFTADYTYRADNGIKITAKSMNSAVFNVLSGNVANVTIEADAATIEMSGNGNYGLLANIAGDTAVIEGATVTAPAVALSGNGVFGGMLGASSGEIHAGNEIDVIDVIDVTVNYTPVDAAGNAATIGGLVGRMTGGTIGSSEQGAKLVTVKGAINLASGTGADNAYVVGGAIGHIDSGTNSEKDYKCAVTNVTSAVEVDENWVGGSNVFSVNTFASNIVSRGPVGMFAGYMNDVKISNCSSTAVNSTYQFLGEAKVYTRGFDDPVWLSTIYRNEIIVHSRDTEASSYTATKPANAEVTKASEYKVVMPEIGANCTFVLDGATRTQTYGTLPFYSKNDEEMSLMNVFSADKVVVTFESASPKFGDLNTTSSDWVETNYYLAKGDQIGRLHYKMSKGWFLVSYRTYEIGWETASDVESIAKNISVIDSNSISGNYLYGTASPINNAISQYTVLQLNNVPSLQTNDLYLMVSGTSAYTGNTPVDLQTAFDERDPMYDAVWKLKNNTTHEWVALSHGASLTGTQLIIRDYGTVENVSGQYRMPVMYNVGGTEYQLYAVTMTPNNDGIRKITFTPASEQIQRNHITYTPMDPADSALQSVALAMVIDDSGEAAYAGETTPEEVIPEETTSETTPPAGENAGGESTDPTE